VKRQSKEANQFYNSLTIIKAHDSRLTTY